MEYTKEELLAKAKRDYPPGTEFYPAHISNEDVGTVPFNGEIRLDGDYIGIYYPGTNNYINTPKAWCMTLYYKGKWATIISTPETKIHFNYLIL